MSFPLISDAAGPIPQRINVPLAKSQTFTNLNLIGVSNGNYSGGAGYGLPISSTNAPYIAFAVGQLQAGVGGVNGAFTQSQSPAGIYGPITSPSGSDGLVTVNATTGAALLLPDTSAPTGYTNCSIATNNEKVYTTDGQSCVCFLGPGGPAAALTAGYVLAGRQLAYNQDGDGNVVVLTQPWLNGGTIATVQGAVIATSSSSSIVLAGAQVGDEVVQLLDLTTVPTTVSEYTAVTTSFESTISVAGHIQQTKASGNGVTTGDLVAVVLQRGAQ